MIRYELLPPLPEASHPLFCDAFPSGHDEVLQILRLFKQPIFAELLASRELFNGLDSALNRPGMTAADAKQIFNSMVPNKEYVYMLIYIFFFLKYLFSKARIPFKEAL